MNIGFSFYINHIKNINPNKYSELLKEADENKVTYAFSSLYVSDHQKQNLKEFISYLKVMTNSGIKLILDVAPECMDWKIIKEINPYMLRLDYDPSVEDINKIIKKYKVCVNPATLGYNKIKRLVTSNLPKNSIMFAYNFYVRKYSGMDPAQFEILTKLIHDNGYKVISFIGNIPDDEGFTDIKLVTLERHRRYDILTNLQDCYTIGVDFAILANGFPNEYEYEAINTYRSLVKENKFLLQTEVIADISDSELSVLNGIKVDRPDYSNYYIRHRDAKTFFDKQKIEPIDRYKNSVILQKSIIIGNNNANRYSGELTICLTALEILPDFNLVGHVVAPLHFLKYIQHNHCKFELKINYQ